MVPFNYVEKVPTNHLQVFHIINQLFRGSNRASSRHPRKASMVFYRSVFNRIESSARDGTSPGSGSILARRNKAERPQLVWAEISQSFFVAQTKVASLNVNKNLTLGSKGLNPRLRGALKYFTKAWAGTQLELKIFWARSTLNQQVRS